MFRQSNVRCTRAISTHSLKDRFGEKNQASTLAAEPENRIIKFSSAEQDKTAAIPDVVSFESFDVRRTLFLKGYEMRNKEQKLFSERVTQRVIIAALIFIIIGVLLIWSMSGKPWTGKWRTLQLLLEQLGALIFVTATITMFWELMAKRSFLDEILVKTQVSRDVALAGLLKITQRFLEDIDWRRYIEKSSKIDIFFVYGRTWCGAHEEHLKTAIKNNNARVRVVLPDPNNKDTVSELARRFEFTPEDLKARIEESVDYFERLKAEAGHKGGNVELWFLPKCPVFSFYRFDHIGVLATYKHEKGRGNVPTFVFEQGGTLYDFMRQEFDAMIKDDGLAAKVNLGKG
jgi:hypothetical protein